MTLQRARYAEIEKLVSTQLEQHKISRPAVPIERVVRGAGISIKVGDLDDASGLLVRLGETAVIAVSETHPVVRQRFTIAHEFGHYLLHLGMSSHQDRDYRVNYGSHESSQATDVEEIEANFFAASILMPKSFLDADDAVQALDDDRLVERLAARYNVSRHAMSLRLGNVYGQYRPF
jgi:Zn-dependent peptidase ImmA (M78 family)